MHEFLQFDNITKSFAGVAAIKPLTMGVGRARILGLIGENGAGKSTLMNILGGVVTADGGTMTLNGQPYAPRFVQDAMSRGVAFIHQELNLFCNLSITENIYICGFPTHRFSPFIDFRTAHRNCRRLLASLELDLRPDTPVERLTPGEKQLVEIAKALSIDAQVIIFDEPTTSLTKRETDRLFGIIRKLQQRGVTVIYISHILEDVRALANDIAVMRDGTLVAFGPIQGYPVERMIHVMVGRDMTALFPVRSVSTDRRPALEVRGLSQEGIAHDIDLNVGSGEIVGIFGLMGSGRSELLRMIFGLDSYGTGGVYAGGVKVKDGDARAAIAAGLALVTDDRRGDGLLMTESVVENLSIVSLPRFARKFSGVLDSASLLSAAQRLIDKLHIRSHAPRSQIVSHLSGGNQQKVVIGKWLVGRPSVLMLDEPTRGIDIGAKHDVYVLITELAAQGAGILFVSSELEELMGTCDRILVMGHGEIVGEFEHEDFNQERILGAAFCQGPSVSTPGAGQPIQRSTADA